MWATRNAITNTHRWSCHGKMRFDSFQVVLLCGWLRTSPKTIWNVSRSRATTPVARAASQIRSSAWRSVVAGEDLVGGVDHDRAPSTATRISGAAHGQAERRSCSSRGADGHGFLRRQGRLHGRDIPSPEGFRRIRRRWSCRRWTKVPRPGRRRGDQPMSTPIAPTPEREEVDRDRATDRRQHDPAASGRAGAPRAGARPPRRTGRSRRRTPRIAPSASSGIGEDRAPGATPAIGAMATRVSQR